MLYITLYWYTHVYLPIVLSVWPICWAIGAVLTIIRIINYHNNEQRYR
jgi:hypothetical protein